jgi:hypothetical protein
LAEGVKRIKGLANGANMHSLSYLTYMYIHNVMYYITYVCASSMI